MKFSAARETLSGISAGGYFQKEYFVILSGGGLI
jgi:hypothetical protein